MHADQRADINTAEAGDIVAVLGLDSASGDTYCSQYPYCTLESMFVPQPVIKVAVAPANRDGADRLSKALHRFRREDPTLHISTDEETGETIMAGMGELHLEIYIERIRREYNVEVEVGIRRSTTGRPPPSPASSTPVTASRRAVRASTPTSSATWSRCRKTFPRPSFSRRKSSAGEFPRTSSPRSRRVFARWSTRDRSRATRWSASR